jgi:Uma2 family endonuclease
LTVLLAPHSPPEHELLFGIGVRAVDSDFIPDLAVVPNGARTDETEHWFLDPPLLVVEILSPSTRLFDLAVKRERYARHGIEWYWILDAEARELLVLRNNDGVYVEAQRITRVGTTDGPISVVLDVSELCA